MKSSENAPAWHFTAAHAARAVAAVALRVWYSSRLMLISERFCAGFALAATIAGDRGAELASAGLHPEIAAPLLDTVRALGALSRQERRDRVRAYLQPRPLNLPAEPTWPERAYVLLGLRARTRPDWLLTGPLPRAGYQPPVDLLALLRRAARSREPSR